MFGAEAGDFLADRFSLATGDFNGDGRDDLLIGAPLADGPGNTRTDAGEAYVIFGSPAMDSSIDLAKGTAMLTVLGDNPSGNLGFTVASGDINGDGMDDLLVGARFAGPAADGQAGEGEAYVIYGRPDLGGTIDIASDEQDVTVAGAETGDYLSIALASGDVNGDGFSDLILGASGAAGPMNTREQAGEVYVVLGSGSLANVVKLSEVQPHLTVWGAQPGDLLANYLASGDVNGDGKAEVIAGAPSAGRTEGDDRPRGEVYIIDVPDAPGSELDLASDQGYIRLRGGAPRDGFGFFVTAADVNGDGRDDVLIGARDSDGPNDSRNNSGEVHLLLDGGELPPFTDVSQTAPDVTIFGAGINDSLGFTVASGDLNGDDIQDVLAGAPMGDGCGDRAEDAGEAYVIFGRPRWPATIDLATGGQDLSLFGAEAGDELGFSLASGDIDGDGRDDIVAGALLADGVENARENGGEAYVILSR
ncbi:MAG: hypothetical protein A2V88_10815 [Elusimicrobia bacterium RBG_16_66_12]|nr:MAG: hypothetical protein A2V88_10815 [Elusimicrobia bacterium RBG_16_66_12]